MSKSKKLDKEEASDILEEIRALLKDAQEMLDACKDQAGRK